MIERISSRLKKTFGNSNSTDATTVIRTRAGRRIRWAQSFTSKQTEKIKKTLTDSICRPGDETLDLQSVCEVDNESLELAIAWAMTLRQHGRRATIIWPSDKAVINSQVICVAKTQKIESLIHQLKAI